MFYSLTVQLGTRLDGLGVAGTFALTKQLVVLTNQRSAYTPSAKRM